MEVIEISNKPNGNNCEHVSTVNSVPRVNGDLTYNEFVEKFLLRNEPCIIDSSITEKWQCRKQWVTDGIPNLQILRTLFGECTVPVANCNEKYYNSQLMNKMTMNKYLDYWVEYKEKNYATDMPLLYLKDWHCVKDFPHLQFYDVVRYFASDWLNEYYIGKPELNDDYMFVYMGPKGTWTPFHADVFVSYSWSANIVGRKRWLLFPPNEENKLRDCYGQLAYDVLSPELNDHKKYPYYSNETVKYFDIIQEAGEVMFVPSGWHHQVWNLENTISVNHNWINACNIHTAWLGLKKELLNVIKEVEDCKEMESCPEHCQLMLKVSYGMDYIQFYNFISFIANKRLSVIEGGAPVVSFNKYCLGTNHLLFDCTALHAVLKDFIEDCKEKSIYELVSRVDEQPTLLLQRIESFLSKNDGKFRSLVTKDR